MVYFFSSFSSFRGRDHKLLLALAEETQDTNELNRLDQKAEEHILAAMACTSEASIEPYLALANLRLSQARIDDARESMQVVKEHISKNMDQIDLDVRAKCPKPPVELQERCRIGLRAHRRHFSPFLWLP